MKKWKEVAQILYEYLVQHGKVDPENQDYKPEEYEDQQYDDWIENIRLVTVTEDNYPNRYELVKEYPSRKIGDTAKFDPKLYPLNFHWELDKVFIPSGFQPDVSDWFKLIKNENSK